MTAMYIELRKLPFVLSSVVFGLASYNIKINFISVVNLLIATFY